MFKALWMNSGTIGEKCCHCVPDLVSFAILRKKEVNMKYRLLDKEELVEMEAEFIRFLATRSIPGPDWEKMKTAQPQRVNDLLEEFSDLVFEKIPAWRVLYVAARH